MNFMRAALLRRTAAEVLTPSSIAEKGLTVLILGRRTSNTRTNIGVISKRRRITTSKKAEKINF